MRRLKRFWTSLEMVPGLSGVTAMWRDLWGAEYDAAKVFLRVKGTLARSYPHRDPQRPAYRVVMLDGDWHAAVDDETGEVLQLPTAEITVWQVDRLRLSRALADGLTVRYDPGAVEGLASTERMGTYQPEDGCSAPVYLTVAYEPWELCQAIDLLVATHEDPFLLLLPSRSFLKPATEDRLRRRRACVLALGDALTLDARDRFLRTPIAEAVLAKMRAALGVEAPERQEPDCVFQKQGEMWRLRFAGKTANVRDMKGLTYITRVMANPGASLAAVTVPGLVDGTNTSIPPGSCGELLDQQAIDAYRRRIEEVEEDLAKAQQNHDFGRQEMLQAELDQLTDHVVAAVGLGGRRRERTDAERLRKSVTMAVQRAMKSIAEVHPDLGRHLVSSIQTGGSLTYSPPSPVDWVL